MLWNLCNMLKCNLSKTEIINLSSRFSPAEPIGSSKVGDNYVQPTSVVKDLGVTLDSHLTLVPPVNNTCVALFRVRFILLAESENIFSKRMLSALSMPSFYRNWIVVSNSLHYGIPSREIENLQRLQNTAARLTVCMKKTYHITPVLKKLHWFPVNDRITFKLLLITYKSVYGLAPVYINESLHSLHVVLFVLVIPTS